MSQSKSAHFSLHMERDGAALEEPLPSEFNIATRKCATALRRDRVRAWIEQRQAAATSS